jgi:formimidoylglutamate deiminase
MVQNGWERDVAITLERHGAIAGFVPNSEPAPGATLLETIVPAMPNVHSHAFQRAIAAQTQRAGAREDDFWSWRTAMYARANAIDPDEYERAATEVFREMLAAGYGSVAEFHYIHTAPGGKRYASLPEMSERLCAAARTTGMTLLLLPVLYLHGDFGDAPLGPEQARFSVGLEGYIELWKTLFSRLDAYPHVSLGVAIHSLRAVNVAEMRYVLAEIRRSLPTVNVHIHIAEQQREVDACLATFGARPIEYLYDRIEVDSRWSLIHATHATDTELRGIVRSGARVGLTPTTEADLGDGIFPLREYVEADGAFGIGSDSNVRIDVAEELRWLEYAQRLRLGARNVLAAEAGASTGESIYRAAFSGGVNAVGGMQPELGAGAWYFDILDLPGDPSDALDRYIFASRGAPKRVRHILGPHV